MRIVITFQNLDSLMGALQFQLHLHHHHHHQQQRTIFMTPISFPFPCNLRATITTTLCLKSILSKSLSSTTSKNGKIKTALDKKDQLKEQWLTSLSCPPPSVFETLNHPIGEETKTSTSPSPPWVIGIDPDVSGALAVLKPFDLEGSSAQVYDSPNVKVLIGNRTRRRMDAKAMVELLRSLSIPIGTTAYIEQSLPYPGDGKQGWWSGGFNYGLWIGVLVASGVSVVPVPSVRWKQEFKLSGNGKTKDDSRALACSLFPTLSSSLKRKKDHGRAEALLIAAYGKGIRLKSDSNSDSVSESLMIIDTDNSTL